MNQQSIQSYRDQYSACLLSDIIPFWEAHSIDKECGAYFTSLDRKGTVFDSDKFVWLQARQVWMFARLYNAVEKKKGWLDVAAHGISFLDKFGADEKGHFYFAVDREGVPLVHPYNIYSDCFACLAYYEYAKASGDQAYLEVGLRIYHQFLKRLDKPKGRFEKSTGRRSLDSFGLPMMTAYMTSQLVSHLDDRDVQSIYSRCIHQIKDIHYDSELGIIREFASETGGFIDTYDGRLINPGHGIEAMWFLMDIAQQIRDVNLLTWAIDVCLQILDYSWDKEFGGLYYFMDVKNAPPQQLEWDQKLWWPHLEALIALSKSFAYTQRADVWTWFEKVHNYTWDKFPDPEFGEWFGYLNRTGAPLLELKGGKWKGCYHLPRALLECSQNFKSMISQ